MPPSKVINTSGGRLSGPYLKVDVIDTGQGNAVLVSYPDGDFMLVDCGSQATSTRGWPFTHVRDYIASVTGGDDITCVVLSHGDDDHTAFVPFIPEAATPTYLHYGGSITDYSAAVQSYIHAQENKKGRFVYRYRAEYSNPEADADFGSGTAKGDAWTSVLSANYGDSPNSRSIVLRIRYGDHAVVLPGDAETDTEAFIISKVPKKVLARTTVLVPGHHGAFEATGRPWAKALDPDIDVFSSSGSNMSYAHPDCSTIDLVEEFSVDGAVEHDVICSNGKGKRYKRSETEETVLVTATNGDVRFITDGTNWRVLASSTSAAVPAPEPPHALLDGLVVNAPWNRRAVAAPDSGAVSVRTPVTIGGS